MPDAILAAVINWNGWRDTLVCLESMLRMQGPAFHLLICDNGSTDESREHLQRWVDDFRPGGPVLSAALLPLASNFGYAGAINRCIAWGREAVSPDYYWLLNNDVALDPRALWHMIAAVRETPRIGLCGSVLLEWDAPHEVQAVGGIFHRAIATGSHLKRLPPTAEATVCDSIDYPVGASMLATREFIESVGVMDESYFLYYEEVDWAQRGRARGFRPAVALRSFVRHKEGASTGSMGGVRRKSMLSEYYGVRNRLRYTRKFSPWLLPVVWLSLLLVAVDRAVHREWRRAALVLRLMFRPDADSRGQ
ncbi:MAG: glycosyltransferase family 2 protein [Pseudomonadota bacterium]